MMDLPYGEDFAMPAERVEIVWLRGFAVFDTSQLRERLPDGWRTTFFVNGIPTVILTESDDDGA